MIRNLFFWQVTLKIFEIWGLHRCKLCCALLHRSTLQTFMEAQWLRVFSLFRYHMMAQSV